MEYAKIMDKIDGIRSTISQHYAEIARIKHDALEVLKVDRQSLQQRMKELKDFQKQIERA